MGLIDFIIIGTIVLSGLFALYRGLVRELLTLVSWALAVLCGFFSMFALRPLSSMLIANEQIADIVTAIVVAIIVLVICTLITAKINKGLRKSVLSGLDRILGFAFGLLRGIVVVVGCYFFCVFAMSSRRLAYYEEKNLLLPYLAEVVPVVEQMLPNNWMDSLRSMQSENVPNNDQEGPSYKASLEDVKVKKKPDVKQKDADVSQDANVSYDLKDLKSMDSLIEEIE